jgi:hypothetical protein
MRVASTGRFVSARTKMKKVTTEAILGNRTTEGMMRVSGNTSGTR